MTETVEITISAEPSLRELLLARLIDLPFEGFEQRDHSILAFMPAGDWNTRTRDILIEVLRKLRFDGSFDERCIPEQNWNRRWEESIRPVHAGRFRVSPTWSSEVSDAAGRIDVIIDPKMSFGTGHHESTRLMLVMLPDFVFPGSIILDAGTGTGILAIAAVKLGAGRVVGFDIDPWFLENAVENFDLNGVSDRIDIRRGSIEDIPEGDFTAILANINRNALIELLPEFDRRLLRDGVLLMSGLMRRDRGVLLDALSNQGFQPVCEEYEGDWWAVASRRKEDSR